MMDVSSAGALAGRIVVFSFTPQTSYFTPISTALVPNPSRPGGPGPNLAAIDYENYRST